MPELDLTGLVVIVACGLYGLIFAVSALRRSYRGRVALSLVLYAAAALIWSVVQVALLVSLGPGERIVPMFRVWLYGALVLAVLFLQLTRSFLRLDTPNRREWLLGLVWLAVVGLMDSNLVATLPEEVLSGRGWIVRRTGFISFFLVAGWAAFMGAAAWITAQAYRRTQQPLHRNRIKFWQPVMTFLVLGDAILFAGLAAPGEALHLLGTMIAAYAVLTHRLFDIRQTLRYAFNVSLNLLVMLFLYLASYLGAVYLIERRGLTWPMTVESYNLLVTGVALALIFALVVNPIMRPIRRVVNRMVRGTRYDPHRTLGEYSLSISNILELERLAAVAVGVINDAVGVERGALFRVDARKDAGGQDYFLVRGVQVGSAPGPPSGVLAADSPVAEYLRQAYQPLMQYDVDLLPTFQDTPAGERAWLAALGMDVYVPIYAKGRWIGLFAFGSKISRDSYFDEDLGLLSTLADQTAVALENARLVEDLVKLNQDLRKAYGDLDRTKQQLEHLDRAKSDFIHIISHELRTPLTILLGYSEIFQEDPLVQADTYQQQIAEGIHHGALRLREVVDSMFDVAKIDSRTLQLNPNPVSIMSLIDRVRDSLRTPLKDRRLAFDLRTSSDLPPIEADVEALYKVFYHLIINAIKYTPDGGRITVEGRPAAEETLGLAPAEAEPAPAEGGGAVEADGLNGASGAIEVIVSDTGIGIDPRFQELIFTKFYQTGEVALHSTGKTKFKGGGPGLGLAIARGIIEAHGGRMWVESEGHDEQKCPGSHFHIVLPVRQQPGLVKTLPAH